MIFVVTCKGVGQQVQTSKEQKLPQLIPKLYRHSYFQNCFDSPGSSWQDTGLSFVARRLSWLLLLRVDFCQFYTNFLYTDSKLFMKPWMMQLESRFKLSETLIPHSVVKYIENTVSLLPSVEKLHLNLLLYCNKYRQGCLISMNEYD